ncbi:hypothetical protein BH10BAC3_BH10BAC3_13580 [soil metagenome]
MILLKTYFGFQSYLLKGTFLLRYFYGAPYTVENKAVKEKFGYCFI